MHSRVSVLQVRCLIFIIALTGLASGMAPAQPTQEENGVHLDQFDMLTAMSGWILLDQHLFWTSDAGQTWNEISPSIPSGAAVQDVSFLDANTGWLLWTLVTSDNSVVFQLAQTIDHGATWTIRSLPLFDSGEIASYAEKAEMSWSDAQTGWISVKQSSGSNFSIGTLFRTSDAGGSWERFPLPVADKISFSDPQVGWAIGGPAGDQVFKTKDAGVTWQDFRPDDLPANTPSTVYMPFYSGKESLLVLTNPGLENTLRVYSLDDPANQWLLVDQETLDVQPSIIGLSILDSRNFVATIPGTTSIVQMTDGELNLIDNQDGLAASIVELDMVSPDAGWAKSVESSCVRASRPDDETASVSCSSHTRLLQTTDGGRTWQSTDLPLVQSDMISLGFSGIKRSLVVGPTAGPGNTEVFIGHGFDKCELPTSSQLQTWWNNGPYETVNLYVGGSSRGCANSALSLPHIKQIYQQGWKFIPTWVGPQAPCTGFISRFSSDVTTAYNQGINEANLAVERLAELGLTNPDKTGSVVYYDMEQYGTDSTCRNAVNAFMSGWVSQLQARGNLAGVYASTQCNTGLSDFLNITNVPDLIWPARWYHGPGLGYYDPTASVWNLGSCVPNTAWANHQRIRQYEGGHNETWGNLTLEIDSNVLDGVVAIPNVFPFVNSITRADGNPAHAVTVDFTINFSETVTGLDGSDFTLDVTGDLTGASITNVTGSGSTHTVTVNTGSGNGTLKLDVPLGATITDLAGNPLGNLPFTGGQVYTIARTWYIRGYGSFNYGTSGDIPVVADYNGDGEDDIAIFRESNSTWYVYGVGPFLYGMVNDIPAVADYNGDGRADIAVFRPSNSTWYIYGVGSFLYGTVNDIPVVADYNGDGRADIAVFRPSNSSWYIRGVGSFVYGASGDIPVVADYNGDDRADVAVFRPSNSTWYIYGVGSFVYGTVNDIPVVADYNGDGRADIAVFRPSNSTWYIRGVGSFAYGTPNAIPVVADYNGDGMSDIAVFRP